MEYQADILQAQAFLFSIIKKQANEKTLNWLEKQLLIIDKQHLPRDFYLAFSTAPRFCKKEALELSDKDRAVAKRLRKGFQPAHWDLLQAVRTLLLLLVAHDEQESWLEKLNKVFETADIHEQQTLYAALPLLPFPKMLRKIAAEGIRTNITPVFDAVALHNPYPADYLDEDAWNQMLLKAVFMQRPLYKIYGADERANPQLAKMLVDFAHERWAAGRQPVPELWRFVAPFLNEDYLQDIKKLLHEGEPVEREAGLLACSQSRLPEAEQLPDQYPRIKEKINSGEINWQNIGERFELKK